MSTTCWSTYNEQPKCNTQVPFYWHLCELSAFVQSSNSEAATNTEGRNLGMRYRKFSLMWYSKLHAPWSGLVENACDMNFRRCYTKSGILGESSWEQSIQGCCPFSSQTRSNNLPQSMSFLSWGLRIVQGIWWTRTLQNFWSSFWKALLSFFLCNTLSSLTREFVPFSWPYRLVKCSDYCNLRVSKNALREVKTKSIHLLRHIL